MVKISSKRHITKNGIVKQNPERTKLEISKTYGGYYRVYKIKNSIAEPFSPREFSSIGDARRWLAVYKKKKTTDISIDEYIK